MDQRITRAANRQLAKAKARSRNVGNLHIINTSIPPATTNPPSYVRTVTMTPKKIVKNSEPVEVKNTVHKMPTATRASTTNKVATISFTKKKINAAKNFLKQLNKESPIKKSNYSKVNLTDSSKPELSSNHPSSVSNNNSSSNISSSNKASTSTNVSLTSNLSNTAKSSKYNPINISHQSHSCLALYEVDKTLKTKKANITKSTPNKEKKEKITPKENPSSSWVPVDMKKINAQKDISVFDNKISIKNKNYPSSNIEVNQCKPVFGQKIPKEENKILKAFPPKPVDTKHERTVIGRYSGPSGHFPFRKEEYLHYEKIYDLSKRSKIKRSRKYKRKHKQNFIENYSYNFPQKSYEARKSAHEEVEALEDVSDVPLDEDFEEVEAASWEDPKNPPEIPVGFRKYKIKYLSSKNIGFFKPKMYHICQNRTVVSCMNVDKEEESVDVVSEAEYEADYIAVKKDSKNCKIDQLKANNNNLGTSSESAQSISETLKQPTEIKTSVGIAEFTNNKPKEKCELKKLVLTDNSNNSALMDTNIIDTTDSLPSIMEKQEVISSSKFYYTCIPEKDYPYFYQGHSLIQKYLDKWESHLIGLEYIVEIRTLDKTRAKKYHCGLCMEQLIGINTDGQIVTNHVYSFKHASAYMAKHFPSCDYKFSKIESSSNVLQRCCKEINHKLSYYFLCVTTDDYFQNNEEEINELLNNLPHWNETDINIDVDAFVNNYESVVDKEVSEVLKDVINKIAPGEEIATFISSRSESAQELRRKKSRNSILDIKLLNDSPTVDNSVTVGRNLIVLTPQHRSITKCSPDHARPNLLQVITQEQTDSSTDNSNKVVCKTTELSYQSTKELSVPCPVDDEALNFKSINKKAVSYRKYRAQQTTDKPNVGIIENENKEISGLRTVRKITKNSGEITVCLESKNIDESADVEAYEEVEAESDLAAEVLDDLSNESGVQILEDSTVDSNFSDRLGVTNEFSARDIGYDSAEVSKTKYKAKHRSHQRATAHSKHCLKRILGKNSRSARETTIKKESSELDIIQLEGKSNDSIESELGRRIKDLSPSDSKTSGNSRKITSPLRTRYSPVFSSDLSRMSVRRRSRSPQRRRSRSPIRRRRSPLRRYSRSPVRRRSRSPRRHSRSPVRRRSRSPKRRSRSPTRRSSRSPLRRHSRSPIRRRSRSPIRKRSRSPIRRRSRSPVRRRSRSPVRRRSRSPVRRRSRSPAGRRSRSPRTSSRRKSRSPVHNRNSQKSLIKHSSPSRKKFESEEISYKSDSRNPLYGDSASKSGFHKEFAGPSHSQYPYQPQHESERDLDPISDEEEPAYFNTLEGPRHLDEIKKLPEPTRTMVMQLLQKFSASKVTPKDPSFSELMQFVNSHNSEMSNPHSSVNQKSMSNLPTSGLALQRFLISNLAETSIRQNLPPSHAITQPSPVFHSSGIPFPPTRPDLSTSSYSQSVFPPQTVQHHGPVHHPVPPQISHPGPPPVSHPMPPQQIQLPAFDNNPQVHHQFHPPQYDNFHSQSEPSSFQPKMRTDGMFKDLKATVNKLFGAIEGNSSERIQLPVSRELMAEQNQGQWGQDPRNSFSQYDSLGPKNVITSDKDDSDFRNYSRGGIDSSNQGYPNKAVSGSFYNEERNSQSLHVPPPDAKVAFCDAPRAPVQKNLFPVVSIPKPVSDVKISLAQRLAAVLVKVGMLDVPGALLQEMLMKIGAFSTCPPQDISEEKIIDILRRLGYLNRY